MESDNLEELMKIEVNKEEISDNLEELLIIERTKEEKKSETKKAKNKTKKPNNSLTYPKQNSDSKRHYITHKDRNRIYNPFKHIKYGIDYKINEIRHTTTFFDSIKRIKYEIGCEVNNMKYATEYKLCEIKKGISDGYNGMKYELYNMKEEIAEIFRDIKDDTVEVFVDIKETFLDTYNEIKSDIYDIFRR